MIGPLSMPLLLTLSRSCDPPGTQGVTAEWHDCSWQRVRSSGATAGGYHPAGADEEPTA